MENLKIEIKDLKITKKDEFPEDGTICILIFRNNNQQTYNIQPYELSVGSYNKENHEFYVNFGYGGLILKEEHVLAWKDFNEVKIGE